MFCNNNANDRKRVYKLVKLSFKQAAALVKDGDIALFRSNSLLGRLIQRGGGGIHNHVGMISIREDGDIDLIEFEVGGGRILDLENKLKNSSASVDIFRVTPEYVKCYLDNNCIKTRRIIYDGKKAVAFMKNLTGAPYGYKRFFMLCKYKLPFIRWIFPPQTDDDLVLREYSQVCSTSVCKAIRAVYVDPVPYKPDGLVEPTDLARSSLLNYVFTIEKCIK